MIAWVLQHRHCGHLAAVGQDKASIEQQQRMLEAAGYFAWHLTEMDLDDAVRSYVENSTGCDTCRIDQSRGLLPAAVQAAREGLAAGLMPRTHIVLGGDM